MGSVEALQYTVNRRAGQVQGLFIFRFGLRGSRLSRESGNPHHRGLRQPSRGKTVWFPACAGKTRAGKTRDCMVSRLRGKDESGKDERLYGFPPARERREREGRETVWFPACAGKTRAGRTRDCMVSRLRGKDESGKDEKMKRRGGPVRAVGSVPDNVIYRANIPARQRADGP